MAKTDELDEYEFGFLYDDGNFRVASHPRDIEGHNLWVGKVGDERERDYFILQKGILREIAERTAPDKVRDIINNFNSNLLYSLDKYHLPIDNLTIALARARIKEVEEEARIANSTLFAELEKRK